MKELLIKSTKGSDYQSEYELVMAVILVIHNYRLTYISIMKIVKIISTNCTLNKCYSPSSPDLPTTGLLKFPVPLTFTAATVTE